METCPIRNNQVIGLIKDGLREKERAMACMHVVDFILLFDFPPQAVCKE